MHGLLWLLVAACNIPNLTGPPAPDCERSAWYPDEDGDGLGETDRVYVGCSPPTDWVTNADDAPDTGADDSDRSEDTDSPEDTHSEDGSGA